MPTSGWLMMGWSQVGGGAEARLHPDALDGKKPAGAVDQTQGIGGVGPLVEGGQRRAAHIEAVAPVFGRKPVQHGGQVGKHPGQGPARAQKGLTLEGGAHDPATASR